MDYSKLIAIFRYDKHLDMSNLLVSNELPELKMNFNVGDRFAAVFEVVKERDDQESVMVFMSHRDGHENLVCDHLFKVCSLNQVS